MSCWSVFGIALKLAIMGDICVQNSPEFLNAPQITHVSMYVLGSATLSMCVHVQAAPVCHA